MARTQEFQPDWFEGELPGRSFRSIFKWGDPAEYKHPNRKLYRLMKETFRLDGGGAVILQLIIVYDRQLK